MIYLVDDNTDYRFLVGQVFKQYLKQYPLRLFAGGLDLLQLIQLPPDFSESNIDSPTPPLPRLILLDVDMPGLNGLQTLERLKADERWRTVPVVMMSHRLEPELAEKASQVGARSYIVKPVEIATLRDVMEQLCQQWEDS